jgi:hypothetical protein
MKRSSAAALLLIIILSSSCRNSDRGTELTRSKEVDPEDIFFDYQITGEEGNDSITVLLQYRYGGELGPTIALDSPGRVQLDGELIKGDSTKVTGAYYELIKPLASFRGRHSILFTSDDTKEFKEEFEFAPITLAEEIPSVVSDSGLLVTLNGIDSGDMVRVLMTDTLFGSEGIDRLDTVKNGIIAITREDLEMLIAGPIQLHLVKENEIPVKNGTPTGGRIYMTYRLKREFLLVRKPE